MKADGKLDFGSVPMLEIDGMKITQTAAIVNYVGATFKYNTEDLLLKHKGEKIVAYLVGDIVEPHVIKVMLFAKEEEKPELIEKFLSGPFLDSLTMLDKLLEETKYICGDTLTQYDF